MTVDILEIGPEALLPGLRNGTGESPVWDATRGRWYWTDIPNRILYRLDPESGALRSWRLAEVAGCLALRPDGAQPGPNPSLVCACQSGLFAVELPDAEGAEEAVMTRLASVAHPREGMRFNDGRCDRQGRFLASTMVGDISLADPSGRWYRLTSEGGLEEAGLGGLIVPNGSAFSPDGRTFYASGTHPTERMVWALDYDTETGALSNRRVFVDMRGMVGRPDGATVDAEGGYWSCALDEGCIKRFTPDGVLDRIVRVPMKKPAMCALGGADGQTMLVTSLSRGGADLETDPEGGRVALFRLPGVRAIPEPRFAG
ncbi:SMP-30/gluconolactonase/LRE family protein [Teichococcus aestuarii]|uniref:SMP-30/gluconolactonase/LRE family protein n=1 Tax=Teichococcus aestuarii TaxID=568898 RepID=UPI00361FD6EF